MKKDSEVIGKKFNRLTIIGFAYRKNNKRYFKCECECGNIVYLPKSAVVYGYTKSCGCARSIHGQSRTRLYKIWHGIKQRCDNPNNVCYCHYGAKNITYCDEWKKFEPFRDWALKNGYKENLSIDRINPDGNYEPNNCRWATQLEQVTHLRMLKTNTSGYTGVSWSKSQKKWLCNISINNKSKRIGVYATQKEAVEARNKFIDDNHLLHKKNVYVGELAVGGQ